MEGIARFDEEQEENFGVGLVLVSRSGRILGITSAFKTITGYESNSFIGKKLSRLLSEIVMPGEFKRNKSEFSKLLKGDCPPPLSVSVVKKGGGEVPMLLSSWILKGAKYRDINKILLLRDLSETQKRRQLEFYRDLLAHDLGNILNNIKFSAQLMEMCLERSMKNGKMGELMGVIKRQVERGTSLLSSVRRLSTVKDRDDVIRETDLARILHNAIENVRSRFRDKRLEISTKLPSEKITVIGGELLRDAFENIMLNGCIHNKSEKLRLWINVSKVSEVSKVFKAREEPEKLVKIEFKDNGTGIRGKMKEAVFEREPKQGSDGSRVSLGLWLVKNIIEEYDGRVRVEDRVSGDHTQGSNFIVYLREV